MRKAARVFVFIFAISLMANCEKDDICVDGDTPFLVIGFFDATDATTEKQAEALRIRALDIDEPVNYDPSTDTEGRPFHIDRSNTDSTAIPLKVNASSTSFEFILNSADDDENAELDTGTVDTLTFNYAVVEDFVSRGCGFVANFEDLDTTRNVLSTDWIKRIEIVDTTVEASNQIHVKIFH